MHHAFPQTPIRCSGFVAPAHVYCRHCGSSDLEEVGVIFTSARINLTASEFGVDADDPTELRDLDVHYDTYAPTGYACSVCDEQSEDLYALIAVWAWRRGDRARDSRGREKTVGDVR